MLYKDAESTSTWGRVCMIVKAIDNQPKTILIVHKMAPAKTVPHCILTRFGCQRLQWSLDRLTGFPQLVAVEAQQLGRLEHIVPNFEELCDRHGLFVFPGDVPPTEEERNCERYWVNPDTKASEPTFEFTCSLHEHFICEQNTDARTGALGASSVARWRSDILNLFMGASIDCKYDGHLNCIRYRRQSNIRGYSSLLKDTHHFTWENRGMLRKA